MADILIDAGPLVAIIDRTDKHHAACTRTVRALDCQFVTTLPAITEAMYLLRLCGGAVGQSTLWKLILRRDVIIEHPTDADLARMEALMARYADRPMDFADASLVAIAERLSLSRIFTVDRSDFTVYRLNRRTPFTVISPI